jgi:exodeoxyribonuclease VII large subunit
MIDSAADVAGVSRVVDYIRRLIGQNKILAGIRVRGEVSGLSNVNGRLYFKLKENADVLECVVWAADAAKLPPFKDGDAIVCGGEYGTYAPRSQYQLAVKNVELTGIGMLYAQFEKLKNQFRAEGLFEQSRKRALPAFPRRIAVVSAPGGKGVEDFFTTIAREAPFIDVIPVETRVQGDGAEMDIGEAIDRASRLNVDVIVVTRGGGSYEDLFPFNREPVVRAIVRAKRPVISAVGHTGDVHLSDLVADHTCETPSNAAHYFGGIGKRYTTRIQTASAQLDRLMREALGAAAQRFDIATRDLRHSARTFVPQRCDRLNRLERRLESQTPQQRLAQRGTRLTELQSRLLSAARYYPNPRSQRIAQLADRLTRTAPSALRAQRERLERLEALLDGMNPEALLARGYAIVMSGGKPVRNARDVAAGSLIEARVQHGMLSARVERNDLDA